jgi:hypothetical protein
VDITPPQAASVLLGGFGSEGQKFQTLSSELSLVWGHFVDVEEEVSTQFGFEDQV